MINGRRLETCPLEIGRTHRKSHLTLSLGTLREVTAGCKLGCWAGISGAFEMFVKKQRGARGRGSNRFLGLK